MESEVLIRKSRPPYWLGLLCLIPLIGAFVGLGLLLYGIFRYKDKWLISIGAFGILFTVLIYGSLFRLMKTSPVFEKGFADISQMQLNSLVKNIEFYKLQNGHYPDRLEQLQEADALAPINDPIQSSKQRPNALYIYKKIGDRYSLFSSGVDGIPKTADDLYPKIVISDSSKIGLLVERTF